MEVEYVFTNGAFITPALQPDGFYRWVVTSFEDDTFMDGKELAVVEEGLTADDLAEFYIEEDEEEE